MPLSEIFLPLRRHWLLFCLSFLGLSTLSSFALIWLMPPVQNITFYSTVYPLKVEADMHQFSTLDSAETSMKIAETVTGWAQNPAFREEIQRTAGIKIDNFKRKISARKQNRMNIFWTIKLNQNEVQDQRSIITAFQKVFAGNWEVMNKQSNAPFAYTPFQIVSESKYIPRPFLVVAGIILGAFLSFCFVYSKETFRGRASYPAQVRRIFPKSALLNLSGKVGMHDEQLIARFVSTFESPRLIGTFPKAEKHFSLAPSDAVHEAIDTPILIIQLGTTTVRELENLEAIFGDAVGIVCFEQ